MTENRGKGHKKRKRMYKLLENTVTEYKANGDNPAFII